MIRPILALFFFFAVVFHIPGSQSRLMTMAAMTESQTFIVDRYVSPVEWSHDWSRTPDGHYYSNKAPGAMLIGFPVYWTFDKILNRATTSEERDEFRYRYMQIYMWVVAFFLQLIPFALLCLWIARWLPTQGVSIRETQALVGVILFGNTVAFYMANWGGHGITALLTFGLGLAIFFRRPLWAGAAFGFSLLCDYGNGMLLLPALIALGMNSRSRLKDFVFFGLGGIVPGALWIWYHTVCFGGPFHIANEFQNPIFLDMSSEKNNLWGVIVPFPKWEPMWQLIIGDKRGIIKTQTWILVFLPWLWIHRSLWKKQSTELQALTVFSVGGLLSLYYMNCCFGSWDGGIAPGPRYMSAVFPLLAFTIALWLPKMSARWKKILAFSLIPPFLYFIVFFPMRMGLFGGYFNLGFNSTLWGQIVEILGAMFVVGLTLLFLRRSTEIHSH